MCVCLPCVEGADGVIAAFVATKMESIVKLSEMQ